MEADINQQNGEKVGDSAEVWNKRFAEQKRNKRIVQYIRFGLAGAFAIVIVIALMSYYRWAGKSTYGRLESYKSTLKTMNISIVLIGVLFGLKWCLEAFNGVILSCLYRKKIICEKWNVKAHIKKHSANTTPAAVKKTYGACVTAAYWIDNPKACKLEIMTAVIKAILEIVAEICLVIFLLRAMDLALTRGAHGIKFKFGDCDMRPLIAAAVFIVLNIIAAFALYSVNNKGFNEWLEKVKK